MNAFALRSCPPTNSEIRGPFRGGGEQALVESGVQGHAQLAMVLVPESDEAEGLKAHGIQFPGGLEHFRHALNGARAALKSNFDEIAGRKLVLDLQDSASDGDGLKFSACPLAAIGTNSSRNGTIELYSGRTLVGVGSGEVSHSRIEL